MTNLNELEIPWRLWVTRPIQVLAAEIGKDITLEGLGERGDFIIENPDPLARDEAPMFLVPREEFLVHYRPAEENDVTSEEGGQGGQEDSQAGRDSEGAPEAGSPSGSQGGVKRAGPGSGRAGTARKVRNHGREKARRQVR